MKKWSIVIGLILFIYGLFQASRYFFDYSFLTDYGKGYVWGSLIYLILGLFLIINGIRKRMSSANKKVQ